MGNSASSFTYTGSCLDAYTPPPPPSAPPAPPEGDKRWANAPFDLLRVIFMTLPPVDVVRAGRACKRWQSVAMTPDVLKRLNGSLRYALWQPRLRLVDIEAALLQPDAPDSKKIAQQFVSHMHTHGFCLIAMPHTEPFREIFEVANGFFNLSEQQRLRTQTYEHSESSVPVSEHSSVRTTQFTSAFRVHAQHVQPERARTDAPYIGATVETEEAIRRYYRAMAKLGVGLMHMIGNVCCPPSNACTFASYADALSTTTSQSHLRFVCTQRSETPRPLPPHTDGGLLTLLPLPSRSGGLEVLLGKTWMPVETLQRRTDLLVIGGATLQHLTARHIEALPHRIVPLSEDARIGVPFLMRAHPDLVLDCSLLAENGVCAFRNAFMVWPLTATEVIATNKMKFEEKFLAFSPYEASRYQPAPAPSPATPPAGPGLITSLVSMFQRAPPPPQFAAEPIYEQT